VTRIARNLTKLSACGVILPLLLALIPFCVILGVDATASATSVTGPSTGNDCAPTTAPNALVDVGLNQVFSDQLGPGWIGGDATYSTKLPNGREAFMFSDTLIGTATTGGSGTFSIAHNSELYGSLHHLKSNYAGSFTSPQPLIPDDQGDGDQWQVAYSYVEDGRQLVFVNEFAPQAGPFDLYTGRSGIAVLSLQSSGRPAFLSVTELPEDRRTQWGNAVLRTASYTYVYGTAGKPSSGAPVGMRVARVPRGDSLIPDDWRYWDGSAWVIGESNAALVPTSNELTGVMAQNGRQGYEAVSIPGSLLSDWTVDLSYACAPQGPWSPPFAVYAIPHIAGLPHQLSYIPTFHPDLSNRSRIVVSYNVNTTDGLSPLHLDVHGYQPRFLQLSTGASGPPPPPPVQTPEAPTPVVLPILALLLIFGADVIRRRRRAPREARFRAMPRRV
jgi:hypothetical protein